MAIVPAFHFGDSVDVHSLPGATFAWEIYRHTRIRLQSPRSEPSLACLRLCDFGGCGHLDMALDGYVHEGFPRRPPLGDEELLHHRRGYVVARNVLHSRLPMDSGRGFRNSTSCDRRNRQSVVLPPRNCASANVPPGRPSSLLSRYDYSLRHCLSLHLTITASPSPIACAPAARHRAPRHIHLLASPNICRYPH